MSSPPTRITTRIFSEIELIRREPASGRGLLGVWIVTHSHKHLHEESSYYLEQWCTIAVCGMLGGVAVLLYYQEMSRFILAPFLQVYILWSGFALLSLAAIRGAFLWSSVRRAAQTHAHENCHDGSNVCDHDHGHAWRPWRYGFLCLPFMLYFLNLPNQGFSSATPLDVEDSDHPIVAKEGEILNLGVREMEKWAYNQSQREAFEGRKGRIKGQFVPNPNGSFTLVRFKRFCCPADVIQLRVVIVCPETVTHIQKMKWVEVTGEIQFRKRRDRDEYVPVLQLQSRNDVQPTDQDEDPYIQ
jgi:hypothetical protein